MSNSLTGYLESQMQALKLKGMLTHYQEVTEKASQNKPSFFPRHKLASVIEMTVSYAKSSL